MEEHFGFGNTANTQINKISMQRLLDLTTKFPAV